MSTPSKGRGHRARALSASPPRIPLPPVLPPLRPDEVAGVAGVAVAFLMRLDDSGVLMHSSALNRLLDELRALAAKGKEVPNG